jgi:hypothetical protein
MINSVRNAVLAILNKNNYGYISPSDFNLFAINAQMEIFEDLFKDYNLAINAENLRVSGTEYADTKKAIEEVMETFLTSKALVKKANNSFYQPSVITTGGSAFMINKVTVYPSIISNGVSTSAVVDELECSSADFITDGVAIGDIVSNTATNSTTTVIGIISSTELNLADDIFALPGQVFYIYNSKVSSIAEKVSNVDIARLNASNLTSPTTTYPSYTIIGDAITCYPNTINTYGAVVADYFRYPKDPKWTYSTLSSGDPVFNQSQPDYQDFELPSDYEYLLVAKILSYCGISIREVTAAQYGIAKEQAAKQTFSIK